MIESWVEDDFLRIWSKWVRGESTGGFSRQSPIYRMMREGAGASSRRSHQAGQIPADVLRTEKALAKLRLRDKRQYRAVYYRHVGGMPDEALVTQLRVSPTELDSLFSRAFFFLEAHLG